jgi:hypothetical protein
MKVHRSVTEPIRETGNWSARWEGTDQGLITCWERGREKANEAPDLAALAREGQLVELPWKGGVQKAIKKKEKYGTLFYLAMWQGLRNEDLNIDMDVETSLVCTATKMTVTYTGDSARYAEG